MTTGLVGHGGIAKVFDAAGPIRSSMRTHEPCTLLAISMHVKIQVQSLNSALRASQSRIRLCVPLPCGPRSDPMLHCGGEVIWCAAWEVYAY